MCDEGATPATHRLVGAGCDTEQRERLARVLLRRPSFLQRWYTACEQEAIARSDDPTATALLHFCLKEAAIKALWPRLQLGPQAVEVHFHQASAHLCLPSHPAAQLELEARCGSDATHAWAEVLAWEKA